MKTHLIRTFFFLPLLLLLVSSCENHKEENEQLKQELEKAQNKSINQDALINEFSETMLLIQQNLVNIRERESNIEEMSSLGNESLRNAKEVVIEDLDAIRKMMDENRLTVEKLNKTVRSQGGQNSKLKRLIDNLSAELAEKDSSIVALRRNLEKSNFRIAEIQGQMDVLKVKKERELAHKEDELNRAFYIAGDYKQLEEKNIVDKTGGFIGLGRVKTLSSELDKSTFTEIDQRTFERLTIDNAKKAEILTPHPTDSYEWGKEEKTINALIIKNKKAFWLNTNTLVILLN